jgi:hypothetical protein
VQDCNGDWGGTRTNYYYYYDLDNDGKYGRGYKSICVEAGDEDNKMVTYSNLEFPELIGTSVNTAHCSKVANEDCPLANYDLDDDCKNDQYDSCGICSSTGSPIATYGGGISTSSCESTANNFSQPPSCTQSVTYTLSGATETVTMDCAGICSNYSMDETGGASYGSYQQTFYPDTDGDGQGAGTAITRCSDPGAPSNHVENNNDPQPDCDTDNEDCNGTCGGSAYLDPHFNDDDCTTANGHAQCVEGTTGKDECIPDCNGDWGGTRTNYYYYYDLDND